MKSFSKIISFMIFLLVSVSLIYGQEINREELTIPLSQPGQAGKLECGLVNGSIKVIAYSGKEVLVVATHPMQKIKVEQDTGDPEKSGMKKISSTSISFSAEESDNVVEIASESYKSAINFEIKVPKNFDLKVGTVNQGDIIVENVEGTLEVSNVNGDVILTNVAGSVVCNTVNGIVKVTMSRVDEETPMSFISFNGDVDISLPSGVKGTARLNSTTGEIYTDFDVDFEQQKKRTNHGHKEGVFKVSIDEYVSGKLNGGGPEFLFKTFSGDIFLRKQ